MSRPSGGIQFVALLLTIASVGACEGTDPSFDAYTAIVAEEDGRGVLGFTAIGQGLASDHPRVRVWAVRALGRQEDPDLLGRITPSLRDDSPSVREAAWFATAQALYREPAADRVLALIGEAGAEADATVLGAMATVLGWAGTPEDGAALRSRAVEALAGLAERIRAADDPDLHGHLGLARGLEALARSHGSNGVVQQAVEDLATPLLTTLQGGPSARAARIRTLAIAALGAAGTVSQAALIEAAGDPDPEVRRAALSVIGRLGRGYREAVPAGLSDPSPTVRVAALAAWDRWVRPGAGCDAAFELVGDPNPNVALTAVDLLQRPCSDVQTQRDLLAELINDSSSTWHRPAHALVALAGLAPEQARASLGVLRDHASPFARAWAARAAAEAADIATLETLARDGNPNVRTAALTGLLATRTRDRDPFVEALALNDPQVVMTALGGLVSTQEEHAVPALEALRRFTERGMWTERDVRMALLDFLAPLPHVAEADLEGYVTDFDPRVAERAATALQERGLTVAADPTPLEPEPTPTVRRLTTLAASQVVLEMAAGPGARPLGRVVIALRPDLAATNADRFARLAERGALDGLTFHRVVPNFVVQGGSPGANEYAGHGSYTRDEISAEGHWRGMVGLSTRGRDTGDAQIFVNLIDNTRLDFNYTILGEVTEGMEVVDRLAEGAVIRTARLERRRAP
ncbi:MAG: hypothetical protein HKO53_14490 [Gemmatimonadetes bacterium]|nr:hypothetical protein [Gemmatimonadota bacterium]